MSDTLLRLFSYDYGKDHCRLHDLPHDAWRNFAARTYSRAVERDAKDGMLIVASWLAMRAATMEWMDDFARWAAKVFRQEYEEVFGHPLHLITIAMEMR